MVEDNDRWFEQVVSDLGDPQNQRVWSVIVSVFGDLAQGSGDQLSGGALTRIVQPAGIRPEAMRVALHRLRKDGWIESGRSGRESMHRLTSFGRSQSAQVTPLIYARSATSPTRWHLVVAEDSQGNRALEELLLSDAYVSLGRNIAMGSGSPPADITELMTLSFSDPQVPDWLKQRIFPDDLVQACRELKNAAERAGNSLVNRKKPNAMQIATLRSLAIHRWRRVLLRHPDVPAAFFPADWTGPDCRRAISDLLELLPRPEPAQLNRLT
ncbi:MAG: PaaX family transcriptional regulator C-terminal domain-containing protein [Pseudomonadota bacterium]